jgi:MFS family permease
VFAVGGAPALLVAFIRYGVREPARWEHRGAARPANMQRPWTARAAFFALFSPEYRRRTICNAALLFISMVGLWAGSAYVPSSVTYLATRQGFTAAQAARLASRAIMLLSAGTILGCLLVPTLAGRIGRRGALAFYFVLMFVCISVGFGYVFYLSRDALPWFIACLFFLGIGGANFAVYTLWLPEQYRTECRASAFAFATSFGRFLAAGITFLVGAGVARMHTIGAPVALTSIAFLVGLALLPLAEETKGKGLPA